MALAMEWLNDNHVSGVISGMAAGWDLALAHAAMESGLPLLAAIPFRGQEARWSAFWKERYEEALTYAAKVHIVSPVFSFSSYHERNQYMVDLLHEKGGVLLALWNGSSGGTADCLSRAEKKNVKVINLWSLYKGGPLDSLENT